MSPTFDVTGPFRRDIEKLDPALRQRFTDKVRDEFVPALRSGQFPPGLRVKRVEGAPHVFEMTWAPDGRATWQYGPEVKPGERHVIWRRIGTHTIFGRP
jgi:hypothetical protein